MKNTKHLLLAVVCICLSMGAFAADGGSVFNNVRKVYLNSMGEIKDGKEVKGYYMFYKLDKADKTNGDYRLELLDANGREIKGIPLKIELGAHLIEGAYNGNAFAFEFYEPKKKSLEFISYTREGKELGKHSVTNLKMMERMMYESKMKSGDNESNSEKSLFPAGDNGFIRYGVEKEKKVESIIEYMDNNMKVLWTWRSDPDDKMMDFASFAACNDNYLISSVIKKKSLMAKDYTTDIMCIDIKTGKVKYRNELQDKGKYYNCSIFDLDNNSNTVFIAGEYYDDPDFVKSNSLGIFAATVGEDGKFTKSKQLSWGADISKKIAVNSKGKLENNNKIFFHHAERTSDGHIYLIAEQYKRVADGVGIAMAALGNGKASVTKINLFDLMIFDLSPSFDLEKVNIFEKKKRSVGLPEGSNFMSTNMIAYILKYEGAFDYEFTQPKPDNTGFSVISTVKAEDEKGKSTEVVNTINLSEDKKFTTDNIEFKEKGISSTLLKAKTGYVMFLKYNKKEKEIKFDLEKINME